MIVIDAQNGKRIFLGRIGENETRVVRFNISDIVVNYPEAEFTLLNKRPGDVYAYPVSSQYISVEGGTLFWTIQSGDLAVDGIGECEIKAEQDGKIVKTVIWMTCVLRALDGSADPPQPWESWVEQVEDAAEDATAAAALLQNASAEAETLDPGASATASYANGVFSFGIPRGADGQNGAPGADGQDGFSPVVAVTEISGGHQVAITDASGTQTFDVMDGESGVPGQDDINKAIISLFQHVAFSDAAGAAAYNTLHALVYGDTNPYQKVAYVETDGASRIDTGVQFDGTKKIVVTMEMSYNG